MSSHHPLVAWLWLAILICMWLCMYCLELHSNISSTMDYFILWTLLALDLLSLCDDSRAIIRGQCECQMVCRDLIWEICMLNLKKVWHTLTNLKTKTNKQTETATATHFLLGCLFLFIFHFSPWLAPKVAFVISPPPSTLSSQHQPLR